MFEEGPNSSTILAWIGGAITFMFTWLIRLERRGSQNLTRAEHEKICGERQTKTDTTLDEIKEVLQRQDERATEFREKTTAALGDIRTNLAVVKVRMRARND